MIKNIGLIKDINVENFIADGLMYIIKTEVVDEKINLQSKLLKLSFDNKVNEIINLYNENDIEKSPSTRSDEIKDYFIKNNLNDMDVIFFADNGLRGIDKVILSENSILYLSISNNIKLGFFVNKTMAEIIFEGVSSVDKNE